MVIEGHKRATVELKLHGGRAPPWLLVQMKKLAKAVINIIIEEFGSSNLLRRLSDPLWFQAFSYILGYDWDSSGVTTVTIGVLKSVLTEEHGIMIAGGKGSRAKNALGEIEEIGKKFGFSNKRILELKETSRIVAKVDNALIQDGYDIYHHAMIISKNREWAIIQQGMNTSRKLARRYHWLSSELRNFVVEPHSGIIGQIRHPFVINITSKRSLETQKTSLDLIKDGPQRIKRDLIELENLIKGYRSLELFFKNNKSISYGELKVRLSSKKQLYIKLLPRKVNWDAIEEAYQLNPKNFEELIRIKGIGPSTLRALALISELIYDASLSWNDPIRYTYAVGGKDGVPYPVNIKVMKEVTEILENALEEIKLGKEEKKSLLKRLAKIQRKIREK